MAEMTKDMYGTIGKYGNKTYCQLMPNEALGSDLYSLAEAVDKSYMKN